MTITSLTFAFFVSVTILVYYAIPFKKYQWVVLLLASSFFYVFNSFSYSLFILFTIVTVYFSSNKLLEISRNAREVARANKENWDKDQKKEYKKNIERKKNRIMAATLVANFGILFVLKYFNFFAGGLMDILGVANDGILIKLMLPLGISFYTFQATGYLIDVNRGTVEPEKNIFKFALFVSYFPQIVQGPISSYGQLGEQLTAEHKPEWTRFKLGIELILWGLFKKMIIADRVVSSINQVCDDYTSFSGEMILFAVLLYALQLYADFSGGIDVIRGVSGMMGIDLGINFRQPYFSRSLSEYWRRWHISLGEWMKKYVFYSLAMSDAFTNMSRKIGSSEFGKSSTGKHLAKTLPAAIATFIVFMLIGIWHGANSRYVGFGLWNGLILMISTLMEPLFKIWIKKLKIKTESMCWRVVQIIRTFILVLGGYYFDVAPDLRGAVDMMVRSISDNSFHLSLRQIGETGIHLADITVLLYGLLIMIYMGVRLEKKELSTPGELLEERSGLIQWAAVLICILSILLFGVYGPGFDPADFVYMGF